MEQKTVQMITAFAFVLIGLALLLDQLFMFLKIDLTNVIRALVILAGLISMVAGVALFRDSRGE
jgi:hypothetical protein